jgi:hypothetical protein
MKAGNRIFSVTGEVCPCGRDHTKQKQERKYTRKGGAQEHSKKIE